MSTPIGAVPSWDQVAALAEAIRDGDLTSTKRELLAQLIEQVGTAVRITPQLLPRCPVGGECMAVVWMPRGPSVRLPNGNPTVNAVGTVWRVAPSAARLELPLVRRHLLTLVTDGFCCTAAAPADFR